MTQWNEHFIQQVAALVFPDRQQLTCTVCRCVWPLSSLSTFHPVYFYVARSRR